MSSFCYNLRRYALIRREHNCKLVVVVIYLQSIHSVSSVVQKVHQMHGRIGVCEEERPKKIVELLKTACDDTMVACPCGWWIESVQRRRALINMHIDAAICCQKTAK